MRAASLSMVLVILALVSSGCAPKRRQLNQLFAEKPKSILIVPAANQTPDLEAPAVTLALLGIPLAERGYYVYSPALVKVLLADMGLTEAGLVHQVPPQRLNEEFGADAILFVRVEDWSTKYLGIYSSVTVRFAYELVSARTGELLWSARTTASSDSGVSLNPIAMAISAAVHAVSQSYVPLVGRAHGVALYNPSVNLPAGHRHEAHALEYSAVGPVQPEP
jgi:hypothetical protein